MKASGLRVRSAIVLAGLLAADHVAAAPPPPPAAAPSDTPESGALVLKAGTPVPLVTLAEISSKTHRQGDRFDLAVASDVTVGGHIVIPRGARAVGEVTRHSARGAYGKSGKLEFTFLYVEVGPSRIRLDGHASENGADARGGAVAAAVAVGFLASIISGRSARVPAAAPVTGYVHRDLLLQPVSASVEGLDLRPR